MVPVSTAGLPAGRVSELNLGVVVADAGAAAQPSGVGWSGALAVDAGGTASRSGVPAQPVAEESRRLGDGPLTDSVEDRSSSSSPSRVVVLHPGLQEPEAAFQTDERVPEPERRSHRSRA